MIYKCEKSSFCVNLWHASVRSYHLNKKAKLAISTMSVIDLTCFQILYEFFAKFEVFVLNSQECANALV